MYVYIWINKYIDGYGAFDKFSGIEGLRALCLTKVITYM